jgi:16S rRNA (guanine527-N7)-methyltransferase
VNGQVEGISAVREILPVSRETAERLETYAALLKRWQRAMPLVAQADLPDLYRRHFADCAQVVTIMPKARRWLDIGSGAGLPGLVVAIVGGEGTEVDLIESNRRKCAFLREVIRETKAPARVHEGRAEDLLNEWQRPVDVVLARAVAPLVRLLDLACPVMCEGVRTAFHKGRDWEREIAEATLSWQFDLVKHDSRIGGGGVILEITNLRRKTADHG